MYSDKEFLQYKKEYKLLQKRFDNNDSFEKAWHNKTGGKYLADAVFAANDGIITTFAVVAGVAGAGLNPLVIIVLGVANLLADASSMGFGNLLGKRSERQYIATQRKKEAWEIDTMPEQEKQELKGIYAEKGYSGQLLEQIVEAITSDRKRWIDVALQHELQINLDEDSSPAKHGLVTFFAFIAAGVVPLLPFVIPGVVYAGFAWSVVMTVVTLFCVGALRSRVSGGKWYIAGVEMLVVGGVAAVVAYTVGLGLANIAQAMT